MIDDAELRAWLRLLLLPGVGREGLRRLLALFGTPEAVFEAHDLDLAERVGPKLAPLLREEPPDLQRRWLDARDWLQGGAQRHVLTLGDAHYPPALLESPDPPLLLFVQGDPSVLARPAVAIVGSRRPTPQGREHALTFSRRLAQADFSVVSGLALGIDAAAHQGALDGDGCTVAVVGTGIDRVYPQAHRELAHRIVLRGALVSEYFIGTPPLAENFPRRNRIIAGLCRGTVVVEAALKSGSLITARLANEAGREVFAIPGSIQAPQSRGCHALIRDGAQLVESADEVLQVLGHLHWTAPALPPRHDRAAGAAQPEQDASRDPLLDALGHDPATLDSLQARTGWPTPELLARLLDLELEGRVARLPGGLYQRRGQA